jgi:2-keto-4-pentenoate hydratase
VFKSEFRNPKYFLSKGGFVLNDADSIKERWCDAISRAHGETKQIEPPSSTIGPLSIEEAYTVQAAIAEQWIGQGQRAIGWKVGATSRAVIEQMRGIYDEPIFGRMTSSSNYSGCTEIKASNFFRLGIEPEIVLMIDRPLRGPGVTHLDVLRAAFGATAAVELIDSRINTETRTKSDSVADNSGHGGIILGPIFIPLDGFDLTHEGVVVSRNAQLWGSACGCEALGNPLNVVSWLANKLSQFDHEIRAGEIVSTGSLTSVLYVEPGDVVDVSFANLGRIQFSITE